MVNDDKTFVSSIANFLLEINNLLDSIICEFTFSIDQFLTLISSFVEESCIDFTKIKAKNYIARRFQEIVWLVTRILKFSWHRQQKTGITCWFKCWFAVCSRICDKSGKTYNSNILSLHYPIQCSSKLCVFLNSYTFFHIPSIHYMLG